MKFNFLIPIFMACIPIFMAYIPIFMVYIPIFIVVMSQLKPTIVRFTGLLISKGFSTRVDIHLSSVSLYECKNFWKALIVSLTDHKKKIMYPHSQTLMFQNVSMEVVQAVGLFHSSFIFFIMIFAGNDPKTSNNLASFLGSLAPNREH